MSQFWILWTTFTLLSDTVRFICSFPKLEILALKFIPFHQVGQYLNRFQLPSNLHTLDLSGSGVGADKDIHKFVNWLNSMEAPPQLNVLEAGHFLGPELLPPFSLLISKLGSSLERLMISFIPC